ncbi:hypothetical protein [Burkholderia sp. Ac-20392]|uniref:hypothetical protein n=1 Tax=Burkholderia sp. Ac-20392 TaxID=2703905 RepID=UPI001981D449|nr:hypothetical protein [Burkholderia sp. Ac-20392]MBN3794369.1 hypothetical protein [Burkholderia sp. Ac-20392]
MSTIAYGILSLAGLVMKRGEPVTIKNSVGMTFGVHCDDRAADDERFVVTNIETGMATGKGVTQEAAIDCARKRIRSAIRRKTLADTFEGCMKQRGAILAAVADDRAGGAA